MKGECWLEARELRTFTTRELYPCPVHTTCDTKDEHEDHEDHHQTLEFAQPAHSGLHQAVLAFAGFIQQARGHKDLVGKHRMDSGE